MAQDSVAHTNKSSMDDILLSIRQIIAETEERTRELEQHDDATPANDDAPVAVEVEAESVDESGSASDLSSKYEARFSEQDSKIFATVGDVLNQRTAAISEQIAEQEEPAVSVSQPLEITSHAPEAIDAAPLVSPEAEMAVAESFQRLEELFAHHGVAPLSDRVDDLLKPMLQSWLDENLPRIVEDLVRVEIERIALRSSQ